MQAGVVLDRRIGAARDFRRAIGCAGAFQTGRVTRKQAAHQCGGLPGKALHQMAQGFALLIRARAVLDLPVRAEAHILGVAAQKFRRQQPLFGLQ